MSSSTLRPSQTVTVPWLLESKGNRPISMLTAYDFATARLLDEAGMDVLLVGDSLGSVVYGEKDTIGVTLDDMIRHSKSVSRAAERAMVLADLPFMTYQVSKKQAMKSAGRLMQEGHVHGVKIEGGREMAKTVRALTRAGIPVCGHIGLTPQSIYSIGRYRKHGKTENEKRSLMDSAVALEKAGAFLLVLECVEESLAEQITEKLDIPTIGIGSGPACDGQVLVTPDLLGVTQGHVPKFVRPIGNLSESIIRIAEEYKERILSEHPKYGHSTKLRTIPSISGSHLDGSSEQNASS